MVLMKKHVVLIATTFWLVLFSCGSSDSASVAGTASSDQGAFDVSALYAQRCATCHGMEGNMSMGGAKKLTESVSSKEEITAQIRYGKGTMPPFGEMLTNEQINALAEYVLSFRSKGVKP
jgi:mono/diheme cytochrome c family protein